MTPHLPDRTWGCQTLVDRQHLLWPGTPLNFPGTGSDLRCVTACSDRPSAHMYLWCRAEDGFLHYRTWLEGTPEVFVRIET